jgi:hypothetical protein
MKEKYGFQNVFENYSRRTLRTYFIIRLSRFIYHLLSGNENAR